MIGRKRSHGQHGRCAGCIEGRRPGRIRPVCWIGSRPCSAIRGPIWGLMPEGAVSYAKA